MPQPTISAATAPTVETVAKRRFIDIHQLLSLGVVTLPGSRRRPSSRNRTSRIHGFLAREVNIRHGYPADLLLFAVYRSCMALSSAFLAAFVWAQEGG